MGVSLWFIDGYTIFWDILGISWGYGGIIIAINRRILGPGTPAWWFIPLPGLRIGFIVGYITNTRISCNMGIG